MASPSAAGSPAAAAATRSGAPSAADPRQRGLPASLRFDPASVLPGSGGDGGGADADAELRRALVRHADVSSPLGNGWRLFPHQKRAVLFALRQRRSVLALDMGTGKTLIGCVWARAFFRALRGDCLVVVICPVSLKPTWERTAAEAAGLPVRAFGSAAGGASPPGLFVASWAAVPARVPEGAPPEPLARSPRRLMDDDSDGGGGEQPPPSPPSPPRRGPARYVVVADEAHSMQAMAAQRTQKALRLMLDPRCAGVLLLTGTPLKNGTPANLFPLLRAVGHPLAASQRDYEAHFCDGRYHSYGGRQPVWKAAGARNLDQLRELSSSHVLYLSKEDVLKGLPGQTRVRRRVPVSAQWRARHAKALQELSAAFYGSQQQGGGGGAGGGGQKDDKVVLGALQRLRKVGSLAKADAAAQIASQVLEKEPAVVVFSSFVDVSSSIHAQLRTMGWEGELLTGETPPGKRQAMVDRFQRGESAAFCATFGAGGVGLTLTAACTIVLVDRPWTPGEAAQAEGTCLPRGARRFFVRRHSLNAPALCPSLSLSLFLCSRPCQTASGGSGKPSP
jgi:hypothetical protein